MAARPFTDLLTRLAAEVQVLAEVEVTWKDADLEFRMAQPVALVHHQHPACLKAKALPGGAAACVAHCRLDQAFWRGRDGAPVQRRCHAGLLTLHAPVSDAEEFLGTLCLSPVTATGAVRARAALSVAARTVALAAPLRRAEVAATAPGLHPAVAVVLARLAAQASANLQVAALARSLGLSPSRLVHLVREQTGRPFTVLRTAAVMRRARALLAEGLPVAQVADRLGFRSPTWFASAFRRAHGVPPSRWCPPVDDQA